MSVVKKGKVTKADLELALNDANLTVQQLEEVIVDLEFQLTKATIAYDALLNYTASQK